MTMTTPNLALGSDLPNATIAGVTQNTDGTLTVSTSHSMLAYIENIIPTQESTTEQSSPTPRFVRNSVTTEVGTDYRVTGFLKRNDSLATPLNHPRSIAQNFGLAQIVHSQAGVVWTYVGNIKSYTEPMQGKGSVKFELVLEMVDIGGPNPVLT